MKAADPFIWQSVCALRGAAERKGNGYAYFTGPLGWMTRSPKPEEDPWAFHDDPWSYLLVVPRFDVEAEWEDHADCAQCNGWDDIQSFDCPTCGASFMGEDTAARCCTDPHFCCMLKCSDECPSTIMPP